MAASGCPPPLRLIRNGVNEFLQTDAGRRGQRCDHALTQRAAPSVPGNLQPLIADRDHVALVATTQVYLRGSDLLDSAEFQRFRGEGLPEFAALLRLPVLGLQSASPRQAQ